MSGYMDFADFYDKLTANISYVDLGEYYDRMIKRFGGEGILLDLGCGTGSVSVEMAKRGYDVIGVDISEEMLSVAAEKPHDNVVYLCQDMCSLDMYGTVDVTICALDSINHLESYDDVQRCFNNVSFFSNKGALFLFDMNTIYKHKEILGNNTFVYDLEDVYCVWQNTYTQDENAVEIWLDIFNRQNGSYQRYEDGFTEIAFSISEAVKMLEKADFDVLCCLEYLSENKGTEDCEKVFFAARKKGEPGDLRLINND